MTLFWIVNNEYTGQRETSLLAGLMITKSLGPVDLRIYGHGSNLNNKKQAQGAVGFTCFPFGNLDLYVGGDIIALSHITDTAREITPVGSGIIGFSIARKVWIEFSASVGEMQNYAEKNGYLVFNSADLLRQKYDLNISIPVSEKGSLVYAGARHSSHTSYLVSLVDPELKFEALNRVRSSYTNPVDGKLREVDVNVLLKLSNRLSDLMVEFTINTNDQYLMSIINTLSPGEQMRQAITILLFETIDLPGISTSTNYMTQQVNQLVASQLNSLTKTTIKGLDISFGVDSYVQSSQSGGEETKTSLSMDLKKSFMNDRAQFEVSGRLNDVYKQPGASDLSLNNISFEYRLDSAATKHLKVYNEHTYEDVFDGEVIKAGIGMTYRKQYWNFSDIWKRKEKNSREKK